MELSEKDLEEMIYHAASNKAGRRSLVERGLRIEGKIFRQVNLGEYGIADLVTVQYIGKRTNRVCKENNERPIKTIHVKVYELKKGAIGASTMVQVDRYMRGIQALTRATNKNDGESISFQVGVTGVIIGDTFDSVDFLSFTSATPFIESYMYRFDYRGLVFVKLDDRLLEDRVVNPSVVSNIKFSSREFVSTRDLKSYIEFLED